MSMVQGGQGGAGSMDWSAWLQQAMAGQQTGKDTDLNALLELAAAQGLVDATDAQTLEAVRAGLRSLLAASEDSFLPELEAPRSDARPLALGGLTLSGLSLETLLDAVGFEQRRTETRAGVASLEARAQERAEANEEKLKNIQEQLEKARKQNALSGLLKAFKIIGMVLAAIGSVAMIAAGAVGLAAGGSGAALMAVGIAGLALLTSSLIEEATGGKAGFSLSFITGKIMEACGASDTAVKWTRFALDLATTIALTALTFGTGAVGTAGRAVQSLSSATAQGIQKAASITARAAAIAGGVNTIAQSATGIVSAANEKDISYLKAQRKHLQAILERIAMANELDMEHIKEMMRRAEQTLQTVSDIVQESVETNTAIMSGNPAMA